jgi:hypothetical protein
VEKVRTPQQLLNILLLAAAGVGVIILAVEAVGVVY